MHPEDRKYFETYARDASRLNKSLSDYYITIQTTHITDASTIESNLRPQKVIGLKYVSGFIEPTESVLIVGCGVGYEIEWFQKRGFTSITGLDVREDRLELCRERYGVETVCADMRDSKLDDRAFDHVVTRQSLHHMFYPYQSLEEVARIANKTVSVVSEPAFTWFKETIRFLRRQRVISDSMIYEYQFRIRDLHRYMAFNGFEVLGAKRYLEKPAVPYALHQIMSFYVPLVRNRFSVIYKRIATHGAFG